MPSVIFLDQNKWIDLARSRYSSASKPEYLATMERFLGAIEAKKIVVPLTAANIYETQKTNDPHKRRNLAAVQAELSGGLVFHSSSYRRAIEIKQTISGLVAKTSVAAPKNWSISNFFLDAFAQRNELRSEASNFSLLEQAINANPIGALYSYMVDLPESGRKSAVQNYSVSSKELLKDIVARKNRWEYQSVSTHRRAYAASLILDNIDEILRVGQQEGLAWNSVADIGKIGLKRFSSEVPGFRVETEIAVKLERSMRAISENDLRDMHNVCATIPYSDIVVLEKSFANMAIQCGLDKIYNTILLTQLSDLDKLL